MKVYFFLLLCCCSFSKLQAQQGIQTAWIINDNFTDNSYQWLIDSTEKYETIIRNNHYDLWNKTEKGGRIFTRGFNVTEKNNYKIEATIQHATGADDKGNGLIIASNGLKNYYRFVITNDGYFKIDKAIDTIVTSIQDWKFSDALKKGTNKISLINLNNHWHFYINDREVYYCGAYSFFGSRMGFYVSSQSGIYCTSFKIYDFTFAASINAPKELIYEAVFYDDFTSNYNGWETIEDNSTTSSINNGYHIHNKTDGSYIPSHEVNIIDFFNYKVETSVRHTAGVSDYGYGMCFGKRDVKNTYVFMISSDGSYQIGEYIHGQWSEIKKWTKTEVVRQNNMTNYLTFEKISDTWNFYINDSLVYSCASHTFFGKHFGCYVENNQTTEFTYFKVSKISNPY